MSTKTNFKRVALVAVAALGAGVLSVAPANAAAGDPIVAASISIVSPTVDTVAAIGHCSVSNTAGASGATITPSALLVFTTPATPIPPVTANATGYIAIESGPASWVNVDGANVNANATVVTFNGFSQTATLKASATGQVRATAYTSAGVAVETYAITVGATCETNVMSVAKSFVQGRLDSGEAVSNIDVAGSLDREETTVKISVALNDLYGNNLTTNGAVSISATNGAKVGYNAVGTSSSAFALDTATVDEVFVTAPTAGTAVDTVVTIAFNGVTVATKSVKIRGKATKIAISDVTIGTSDSSDGYFAYQFMDAAGNVTTNGGNLLVRGGVIATSATGLDSLVTAAVATLAPSTLTGTTSFGDGAFTCAPGKSGSTTLRLAGTNSSLDTLLSDPVTLKCAGGLDTWTVSLDKASYAPGEIATLTITGKDSRGQAVSDNTAFGVGTTASSTAGAGGFFVSGPTDTTKFVSGSKTFKIVIGNVEGAFAGTTKLVGTTDASAKAFSYVVKATNPGVTNADVLKAIVSLIASINKQIAALQKALLKKK